MLATHGPCAPSPCAGGELEASRHGDGYGAASEDADGRTGLCVVAPAGFEPASRSREGEPMGSNFTNLNAGCHESVPLEAQFASRMPPSNEDARRREGDASSASS